MNEDNTVHTPEYDYLYLNATHSSAHELQHVYEKLGYTLLITPSEENARRTLTFRRERKTKNKAQLCRLQVRLADLFEGIRECEKGKTFGANVAAVLIAVAGTLIFGGGMSLCMLFSGFVYLLSGSIVGLAGAAVCYLAYAVHQKIKAKMTPEMNGRIEKKREAIALLLEEAQKYL